MSYRCEVCTNPVGARHPRLTHALKRPDGSISRELAVCHLCRHYLAAGYTVTQVVALRTPAPPPPPRPVVVPSAPALAPPAVAGPSTRQPLWAGGPNGTDPRK